MKEGRGGLFIPVKGVKVVGGFAGTDIMSEEEEEEDNLFAGVDIADGVNPSGPLLNSATSRGAG